MNLPIDTSAMTFLAAGKPEQVVDFTTKAPKTTTDGQLLYTVPLIVLGEDEAEIIAVKVPGEPRGIGKSTPVKVTGLVAAPWTMGERSGIAYRAESIESAATPARVAS